MILYSPVSLVSREKADVDARAPSVTACQLCQPGITAGTVLSAGNKIRTAQSCCSSLLALRPDVCLLTLCVYRRERMAGTEGELGKERAKRMLYSSM